MTDPVDTICPTAHTTWRGELPGWCEHAACATHPDDLWFPPPGGGPEGATIRAAKRICGRCPVRQPCLDYAITARERFGIWGGATAADREQIRREREIEGRRQHQIRHATDAGHAAHLRRDENPCLACLLAHHAAQRRRDQDYRDRKQAS